ncbi:MAG: hypothetical protein ACYST0_13170, partial [Planctomycetota bacterium]
MQQRHPRRGVLVAVFLLTSAAATTGARAQVPSGQYLTTVRAPGGEMYYVDPQARRATGLTISATLATDWANCVVMTSPSTGYVGTFNNPSVYAITLSGTKVTEKKLNTSALATGEVSQIAVVAGTLYFAQPTTLWSMSVAGGAPTQLVDMTKVTGWPTNGLVNALAASVRSVYLGVWPVGEVFVYDMGKKTTSLMLTLPASKFPATGFSPVNMQLTSPAIVSSTLMCCGLYGDVVAINATTGKVTSHLFHKTAVGAGTTNKDSFTENTDT